MYVFRIIDVIDRSKAWYKGEVFASNIDVAVTNPPTYVTGGNDAGDTQESAGYIYTSLKDNNQDIPKYNYVGYPVDSANSWIRSGYANRTKMLTPESGGITESYGSGMSGTLRVPTGSIPTGIFNDSDAATCCLFYGVLGKSITINGHSIALGQRYGNPELTDRAAAVTVSTWGLEATAIFNWSIAFPTASTPEATYCSGAYQGTWSYLGVTQWTDHKKSINDYSRQEQDEWGNYSLSKRRSGRTYSAEVILTPRKNAVEGDYDYDLTSLCFSVLQLLRSLLGKPAAFYFNNQDISCITAAHNVFQNAIPIRLVNSDIIVGVLQNFEITEMSGNKAVLKMSVNSVPNEYEKYGDTSGDTPPSAPVLPTDDYAVCTDITWNALYNDVADIENDVTVSVDLDTINFTSVLHIVPTPSNAPVSIASIEAFTYTSISVEWVPDPSGYSADTLTVTYEGKGDPIVEWDVIDRAGDNEKVIRLRGTSVNTGNVRHFFKVNTLIWGSSNTYEQGEMFYTTKLDVTVT